MAQDGTYGDHLTLHFAADLYNMEFIVISSLGPSATAIISPLQSLPLYSFHIGHFAEGDGDVKLQNDPVYQNLDVRSPDHNDTSFESPEEEGVLNIDVQKKIVTWTLAMYPYMRQTLRAFLVFSSMPLTDNHYQECTCQN